jgi:hypothetical protein
MLEEFPRENNTGYDIEKEGQLNKYIKCNSSIAHNPATVLTSDHVGGLSGLSDVHESFRILLYST